MIFLKGSIVAFDKGYFDYEWYKTLTDKGIFFVTRLRANAVYEIHADYPVKPGSGVLADQDIQPSSAHAQKRGAPPMRRVVYHCSETDKTYEFFNQSF